MKKLFAFLMALVLVFSFAALAEEDNSLKAIQEKGYLILGLDDSFPPMGFNDENGNIVECLQVGNTVGSNKNLFAYLKANVDEGYAWEAVNWNTDVLTVGRTGAEQDTDKSQPGVYWEVFYFNPLGEGVSDVEFALKDADGNIVHSVIYELHVDESLVATVKLPG